MRNGNFDVYMHATPSNEGRHGELHWRYWFAHAASKRQYFLFVLDMNDPEAAPRIMEVEHDLILHHEIGDTDAVELVRQIVLDCIQPTTVDARLGQSDRVT
jgi:hypothetical protein